MNCESSAINSPNYSALFSSVLISANIASRGDENVAFERLKLVKTYLRGVSNRESWSQTCLDSAEDCEEGGCTTTDSLHEAETNSLIV